MNSGCETDVGKRLEKADVSKAQSDKSLPRGQPYSQDILVGGQAGDLPFPDHDGVTKCLGHGERLRDGDGLLLTQCEPPSNAVLHRNTYIHSLYRYNDKSVHVTMKPAINITLGSSINSLLTDIL